MNPYAQIYLELRAAGETEENAARHVDMKLCEDAERRRLKREPTEKEVRDSYHRMGGAPQS